MTPIDELIETWLAKARLDDWWREAMANLRPTAEDDAIFDDEEPTQDV